MVAELVVIVVETPFPGALERWLARCPGRVALGPRVVPSPLEVEGVLALSLPRFPARTRSTAREARKATVQRAALGHLPAPQTLPPPAPDAPGAP